VRLGDDVLFRGAVSFPKRAKRRVTKAGPRKAARL
jgi:hypothetical protein